MSLLSTTIRIPAEDIRKLAERIDTFYDKNKGLYETFLGALRGFQSSGQWQGKDIDELILVTEQNAAKYEKSLEEFVDLGQELSKFATAMEEKDADLQRRINAI